VTIPFTDAEHHARAVSFDDTAEAYEYGRPGYPTGALDWWASMGAGLGADRRVLDLAAGTGKLTRQLLGLGCDVVAVEPLANMREQFELAVPGVPVLDGTAEAIPLAASSVDCVLVGQAFHWFDGPAAMAEISRVLRPGGGLGMIWNGDDTSVSWVSEYSDQKHVAGPSPVEDSIWRDLALTTFERFADTKLAWSSSTDRARLVANALSRSYISVLAPSDRAAALLPLVELLDGVAEPIEFPMNSYVCWCDRPKS
jgi:SAM-dependent methyltransferase